MTGFGRAEQRFNHLSILAELRCLNSKTLDLSIKLPASLREKEQEIRSFLAKRMVRGKVELLVTLDNQDPSSGASINHKALKHYYAQLKNLAEELGMEASPQWIPHMLRLPDTLHQPQEDLSEEVFQTLTKCITQSVEKAEAYRLSEGEHLRSDLLHRLETIRKLLSSINPMESSRIDAIRQKIHKALEAIRETHDPNRFEQELIYYLEKLDITEEKVRLNKHLDYFLETLGADESSGKMLGFITQEMGREINTIGSKANDAGIQKVVVQMKDELEKIKEQLMNIL